LDLGLWPVAFGPLLFFCFYSALYLRSAKSLLRILRPPINFITKTNLPMPPLPMRNLFNPGEPLLPFISTSATPGLNPANSAVPSRRIAEQRGLLRATRTFARTCSSREIRRKAQLPFPIAGRG